MTTPEIPESTVPADPASPAADDATRTSAAATTTRYPVVLVIRS
jgi:hypothetical protein